MFNILKAVLCISLLFVLPLIASAQEQNYFKVAEPWSPEIQQKYYGEGLTYNAHLFKAINSVLYETPVSLLGIPIEEVTNPATGAEISQIVTKCRQLNNSWHRIACAAQEVEALLADRDYGVLAAPCRAMSSTFIKVFRRLNISRAWVGYKAANFTMPLGKNRVPFPTFHVANLIILTGSDGQIYSYVLDLAFYKNNLYPISRAAIELHCPKRVEAAAIQILPRLYESLD